MIFSVNMQKWHLLVDAASQRDVRAKDNACSSVTVRSWNSSELMLFPSEMVRSNLSMASAHQ
jgi:hypothetical protein